jgi:hypothetical protein
MSNKDNIKLLLLCVVLASCHPSHKDSKKYYVRGDSTAPYSKSHHHSSGMWFYAFRPYGTVTNGAYSHVGYSNSAIHQSSNIGSSHTKSSIFRGGFGSSGSRFSIGS